MTESPTPPPVDLPPLPNPTRIFSEWESGKVDAYTAEQMHAYARAALSAQAVPAADAVLRGALHRIAAFGDWPPFNSAQGRQVKEMREIAIAALASAPAAPVACYRLVRKGAIHPASLDCWQDGAPSAYTLEYAAKEGMRVDYAYHSAPAAPVSEAVAWRYRIVTPSGARGEWFFDRDETKTEGCIEAEPLYAHPPAAPVSEAGEYRLLVRGDIIQRGDTFLSDDTTQWRPLSGWEVGMQYDPCGLMPGRRLVATPKGQEPSNAE